MKDKQNIRTEVCVESDKPDEVLVPETQHPFLNHSPQSIQVNIFDEDNPYSLFNKLQDNTVLYESLKRVWEEDQRLLSMDLTSLKVAYRKEERGTFTPAENRLRMQFWVEYDNACMNGRKMKVENILTGVGTRLWFTNTILPSNYLVAFIFCCPITYQAAMLEALNFGLDQMRDILNMENVNENNKPNVKLMELKGRIFTMLDQRVNGGFTQKQVHLHAEGDRDRVRQAVQGNAMVEIEDRLKILREKHARLTGSAQRAVSIGASAEVTVSDTKVEVLDAAKVSF